MERKIKSIKVVLENETPEQNPVILISGTPGTGKSTILNDLKKLYSSINVLNISDLVKMENLHDGYDSEFDTYIINDRKTRKRLIKLIPQLSVSGPVLIECHSCGLFDKDELENLVTKVLVLTCSTESLHDRLELRGYSKKKIGENLECEIMRVCAEEAGEVFRGDGVVVEMENDVETDRGKILDYICDIIKK